MATETGPGRSSPQELRFGEFRYRPEAGELVQSGHSTVLPPRAAAVLDALLQSAGEVVLKEHLLAAAWPDSFVAEDSLTHAVSVLRQALRDDARNPRFIQTIPRRGYRWIATVESVGAAAAEPRPAAGETGKTEGGPGVRARRGLPAVAIIALAIVAAIFWFGARDTSEKASPSVPRIARLGLLLLDEEPLVPGLATALSSAIEERTGLEITEVGMVNAGPATDALLSVRVERRQERFLLTAEIRTSPEGESWWHQEWDLPVGAAARPEAIAASIVTRMRFLIDHASALSTLRRPQNQEALRLEVHAARLMLGPAQQDLNVALEASEALRRAVELDSAFARARAGRVATLVESAGWRAPTALELEEAQSDLTIALRDDPYDPVVHVAAGLLALLNGEHAAALAALDRARDLAADMFWIYMVRADVEMQLGAPELALATAHRGLELDPFLPAMHGREVDVLLALEDFDRARSTVVALEELDPGGYWSERARFRLSWRTGEIDQAERTLLALRDRWGTAPWVHTMAIDFAEATGRAALAEESTRALEVLRR